MLPYASTGLTPRPAALLSAALLIVVWGFWWMNQPYEAYNVGHLQGSDSDERRVSAHGVKPEPGGSAWLPGREHNTAEPTNEAAGAISTSLTRLQSPPKLEPSKSPASKPDGNSRPLITYVYAESDTARENIKFFIDQGLHGAADFVFILNGETNISSLIPEKENVRVVHRENTCFDLGAHGEVLRTDGLWKRYKRFILLNASIRGPFLPYWSQGCWTDIYLNRVTDEVKLVGMTANCWPAFHVQSMIWATDDVGMRLLLNPPPGSSVQDEFGLATDQVGLGGCYDNWHKAVHAEIGATLIIRKAGHKVDVMMTAFHKSVKYIEECDSTQPGDLLFNGRYFGTNIHPYETVFIKANRDIDPILIDRLTGWHDAQQGRTSWDLCT